MSEDRGQMSDDRRYRSEGRRQMEESGCQGYLNAEFGKRHVNPWADSKEKITENSV
jgi:hypothetical protein